MSRTKIETINAALSELPDEKSMPSWLERDILLPFSKLSGDEFEILCYLLLRAKFPNDRIYCYGKTKDMGRDIIHVSADGYIRLIQCKNYASNVSPSAVAKEMAKVYANVHSGKIPERPHEVVFFISADLSSQSKDLITYQEKWREIANVELKKHLKEEPSDELKEFASDWWPFGDRQTGLTLTQDVIDHNAELIEMFFGVKKVIDGSIDDVRQVVNDELDSALKSYSFTLKDSVDVNTPSPELSSDDIRSCFSLASKPLSNWPRTLGNSQWIERQEVDVLCGDIEAKPHLSCVLLGDPGSGKSALFAHLVRRLEADKIACLGIKADMLDVNVDSLGKLAERLNLPATIADCVKVIAGQEKVVVLIDQLDALADLVDLKSGRLNVLLSLIHELAAVENIYVIASSRTFEFHHDSRFRIIETEEIHLELPEWESINDILQKCGIDGTNWPDSFREILRVPQNLKIFIDLLDGQSEQKVFDSYQQMLEELWRTKVTHSPDAEQKSELLSGVSAAMADKEIMWLPLARFDKSRELIDKLIADGILRLADSGMRFGFQHQTLFSHARARAIVRGEIDLCDYVIERQHALFVRPTLWSTLSYLREVAKDMYVAQMNRLYSEPLRLHIQHLLFDFLGRLQNPDDLEETWLVNWIENDDFKNRAIVAISESVGWFGRLKESHIAELMKDPRDIEWRLVGLLSNAINHSHEATVSLLEEHWLNDLGKDQFTFRIFDECEHWTEKTVAIVCRIIGRTAFDETFITGIASTVSAFKPELAPQILAAGFRRQLLELQREQDPPSNKLPAGVAPEEQLIPKITYDPKKRFKDLLTSSSGRYDMPAIAEAASRDFLDEMWPLFIEALLPTLDEPHHIVDRFRASDYTLDAFDRDVGRSNDLLESIQMSLLQFGNTDSTAFETFFRRQMEIDAMLVQRMLCRCLVKLESTPLSLALGFLTSDPRRLAIGDFQDRHADSRKLINKISSQLDRDELQKLLQHIRDWTEYHPETLIDPADIRYKRNKWDRKSRLRLFLAIPKDVMNDEWSAFIAAEEIALPDVTATRENESVSVGFSPVMSPMSTEQMVKAQDEHILKLFDELTDMTVPDHPRRLMDGGTIEASRALAELAKENPERAAHLVQQLRSDDQQVPAAHVIQGISESDYPASQFYDLIRELVKLEFNSEDFQDAVASACRKKALEADGLRDDICELLKTWLLEWEFPADSSSDDEQADLSESDERSVIYGHIGSVVIPRGTYSILSAISYGLIRKNPRQTEEWLDVLENHLERAENPRAWQILWQELRMLTYCSHSRATRFLKNLFAKYQTVRDSLFGVRLINEIRGFLGENTFFEFSEQIGKSKWPVGKQAQGELLGISYIAGDGFPSVEEFVEQNIAIESSGNECLLEGIAHACANLWQYGECRLRATEVFEKLVKKNNKQVNRALAHVFLFDKFVPNTDSKNILLLAAEHSGIVYEIDAYRFAEKIEPFVTSCPDTVLKLANVLLDQLESQKDDKYGRNFDLADAALTRIAMTLQRNNEKLRKAGLDLFERLLKLGFSATIRTLHELDNRPVNVRQRSRKRRRRGQQKT